MAAQRKLTTSSVDRGRALADFLADRLAIDRDHAETLVRSGAVHLDRRRIEDPSHLLEAAHRLTVYLPAPTPSPAAPRRAPAPSLAPDAAPPLPDGPLPDGPLPAAAPPVPDGPLPAAAPPLPDGPLPAADGQPPSATSVPVSASIAPALAPTTAPASSPELPGPSASASSVGTRVGEWVAYQDSEVIVIDKPAGVASQATRSASSGALDRLVVEALDADARLLHRIDRDASGLVLFTRTTAARRRFAQLLAEYQLERTYCAAVWGHWQRADGALSGPIGRDPRDHRRMAVGPGRPALTRFRLIRRGKAPTGEPVSLLQLELVTGRTHQIRVHLAYAGHPICGDALYDPDRPPLERLFLHAHRLAWPAAPPVLAPVPPALSDLVG